MLVLEQFLDQLGVVGIPLLILSIIMVALILDRLVQFSLQPNISKGRVKKLLSSLQHVHKQRPACGGRCGGKETAADFCQQKHCLHKGVGVLLSHADCPKDVREEIAALWLLQHRQRMHSGLRILMLVGTISPMVGLLGTVLGMITMFQGMADVTGPVTPAVLADGLWTSMYTTACGLMIAIPALGASQAFSIWANSYIGRLEYVLNHVNLLIEGVNAGDGSFDQPRDSSVKTLTPRAKEPLAA